MRNTLLFVPMCAVSAFVVRSFGSGPPILNLNRSRAAGVMTRRGLLVRAVSAEHYSPKLFLQHIPNNLLRDSSTGVMMRQSRPGGLDEADVDTRWSRFDRGAQA